jgi:hypothetical protein
VLGAGQNVGAARPVDRVARRHMVRSGFAPIAFCARLRLFRLALAGCPSLHVRRAANRCEFDDHQRSRISPSHPTSPRRLTTK